MERHFNVLNMIAKYHEKISTSKSLFELYVYEKKKNSGKMGRISSYIGQIRVFPFYIIIFQTSRFLRGSI